MFYLSKNFFSTVCLGSFNPSILSIEFIEKNCKYKFEKNPKEEITPVFSKVEDSAIQIIVDFSKFQLLRKDFDQKNSYQLVLLATNYLDVLKYTPLNAFGINFNYEVSNFEQEKINNDFYDHIKLSSLKMVPTAEIVSTTMYDENTVKLRGVELRIIVLEKLKARVGINNLGKALSLNINFEINNLDKNRERIKEITDNFNELITLHENIIKTILLDYIK